MPFIHYDKMHFLEPPHEHNPADVAHLTDLPASISGYLPKEVEELLALVQEATSIAFASLNRLYDILSQRLAVLTVLLKEHMKPGEGSVQRKSFPVLWQSICPMLCRNADHSTYRF
jgi:hypothetical protein